MHRAHLKFAKRLKGGLGLIFGQRLAQLAGYGNVEFRKNLCAQDGTVRKLFQHCAGARLFTRRIGIKQIDQYIRVYKAALSAHGDHPASMRFRRGLITRPWKGEADSLPHRVCRAEYLRKKRGIPSAPRSPRYFAQGPGSALASTLLPQPQLSGSSTLAPFKHQNIVTRFPCSTVLVFIPALSPRIQTEADGHL